ncbi:MAG: hypothetical protein FD174_3520 [Geobacteraceae bacterium]|nr:MAG: hypothetical protein FD174_3520 [Geobacteraceae bacterium]
MGYRYDVPREKADEFTFRMMEVVMVESKAGGREDSTSRVMIVDGHWETLRFVQENMNDFVSNIIRVKKMTTNTRRKVEDNAKLFEHNLQPLFSMISETAKRNVLDKLSNSLKKALILMAMDRYNCDKESICRALGISQDKLEREMTLCGLVQNRKAA